MRYLSLRQVVPIIFFTGIVLLGCKRKKTTGADVATVDVQSKVISDLKKQYRVLPYYKLEAYKFDFDDYAACFPDELKKHFKDIEARTKINRYELFTVAVGEGLGSIFDYAPTEADFINASVSGYDSLGMDNFGSELPSLRAANLLPPDFKEAKNEDEFYVKGIGDFIVTEHVRKEAADGGKETRVRSAMFRNMKSALTGFAALYGNRRRMFEADAKGRYPKISIDEYAYWDYYYYQNPGLAASALNSRGIKVVNLGLEPDAPHPKSIPMKSLKRVATMRDMMSKNVLDLAVKCNADLFKGPPRESEPVGAGTDKNCVTTQTAAGPAISCVGSALKK